MNDGRYVLDTSAILTLIEDEPGAARVEHVLRNNAVIIPWICSFEVLYITQQKRGIAEAERRYALIKALPVTHLWELEEALVLTAARLKATYRLSLADTMIAACALREQSILLHKDPEYEVLATQIALEHLPYKSERC
ncbi:PIN domain-containing protein [Candidatus Viridilinea mediisalina]|uniref:PIN domain-containing protein n=1 Tax=Candidatus Viridilinea mediisalina TaxID=2024553 RepID=UPI001C2C0648|nr:PIN domain-containing protein [Candidatus Viridilinea mediisalina]